MTDSGNQQIKDNQSPGNGKPDLYMPVVFASFQALCQLAFILAAGVVLTLTVLNEMWMLTAGLILVSIPAAFYWLYRSVASPYREFQQAFQNPELQADSVEARSFNSNHSWLKHMSAQLERLDQQNQILREELEDRTQILQEQNSRLRVISEELGRSYSRMDDEMKVLGRLQKSLLPDDVIDMDNFTLRSFYLPNGRAGGDYFDVIPAENGDVFLLIADVSGHGSPAAFIMGITRAIIHTEVERQRSPAIILNSVNQFLMKSLRSGEFVTMFIARIHADGRFMTYSNAGHIPPMLINRENGTCSSIENARWLPLGVMGDSYYDESTIQVNEGDRLFLCTDGLIESQNQQNELYGMERVVDLLQETATHSPESCLDALVMDLEIYANRPLEIEPLEDDVTLMVIEFHQQFSAPAQTSEAV